MSFDPSSLTWTCHVCREERPDAKISVLVVPFEMNGVRGQQNVRYCNDRPECLEGAAKVDWIKPK